MKRVAVNTSIVLATLAGLYVLWEMRKAAVLFLLSLGVAAALRPVTKFLARRGLPQWLAITIAYLVALGIPAILLLLAGQPLIEQARSAADDVARAYDHIKDDWIKKSAWRQAVVARLPPPEQLSQALVGESGASLATALLGATFSAFGAAIDFVLMIFLSIYWSIDRVHFERLWLSLLPARERSQTRELWRTIEAKVGDYARSEAVQAIAAGLVLWLGYVAIGQPYPALLALIGALVWLIPWVGAAIALAAVLLLSLPKLIVDGGASFMTVTLPAACFTVAVLLVLELTIEPKFFNRRSYNALVTAIVAIGMAEIWGVLGLLLGPPVSAIMQIAAWQWINRASKAESAPAPVAAEAFEQRYESIREAMRRVETPRPELLTFVERLENLVHEARRLSPPAVEIGWSMADSRRVD
ncbi:MAG TPA: AI-2E family transporter [Pirellulales bacterium]|nr:AI-2E family transporter [Pirellulales bacterium]